MSAAATGPQALAHLNVLRNEALDIAKEHGFKDASVGEDIALMHSELSEALEAYRDGMGLNVTRYEEYAGKTVIQTHDYQVTEKGVPLMKPAGIPSEMADVIIRVLHFCGKHNIDIARAVGEKMAYNRSRPYKHGGKKL